MGSVASTKGGLVQQLTGRGTPILHPTPTHTRHTRAALPSATPGSFSQSSVASWKCCCSCARTGGTKGKGGGHVEPRLCMHRPRGVHSRSSKAPAGSGYSQQPGFTTAHMQPTCLLLRLAAPRPPGRLQLLHCLRCRLCLVCTLLRCIHCISSRGRGCAQPRPATRPAMMEA